MSKIIEKINHTAAQNPHKIALVGEKKIGGKIVEEKITYRDLANKIKGAADELTKLNYHTIALIADNSPAWVIFDLACLLAKITLIPLPHFFTKSQIANALKLENVAAVFCDSKTDILPADYVLKNHDLSEINFAIFENALTKNAPAKHSAAKITFTSGSTGNPKGIALGVDEIEAVLFSLLQRIGEKNIRKNLSILPLSILLENLAGVYLPLVTQTISVVPNLELVGIKNSSGIDIENFVHALKRHDPSTFITSPELAKLLIFLTLSKKVSAKNFSFIAVGGAKVAKDLLDEAEAVGIPLYQGYGLSECCSVVALNSKAQNKNGSVGKILPHVDVKIAVDGEILVKGKSLAQNIALNKDGYYATGDMGYFDEDGFLFINGRKKNIFITSMMRNVNPEWVESEFLKSPLIAQIAVFGEGMAHNAAVVIAANPKISKTEIEKEIARINGGLPDYAQVQQIILSREPFTNANGMLTGNGRPKRSEIWQRFF